MRTTPILFNKQQYDLLQLGLTAIMKGAQQHGEEDLFRQATSLSSALEQNMMQGDGMNQELRERFQKRITMAQQKGDGQSAARALRDLMAALVRVEADPARAVANTCMTAIMRTNMAGAAAIFIPLLQKKLVGLQTEYERDGYPSSADVLTYLHQWLAYGQANLENGEEAWPDDEHFKEEEPS